MIWRLGLGVVELGMSLGCMDIDRVGIDKAGVVESLAAALL